VALPLYVLPTFAIVGFARGRDHIALVVMGGLATLLVIVALVVARCLPGRSLHDLAAHTNVVVVSEPEAG